MKERLVRRAEAAAILGVSVATLDRMARDGRIPAPIALSSRVVGWREQTLIETLKALEGGVCSAAK